MISGLLSRLRWRRGAPEDANGDASTAELHSELDELREHTRRLNSQVIELTVGLAAADPRHPALARVQTDLQIIAFERLTEDDWWHHRETTTAAEARQEVLRDLYVHRLAECQAEAIESRLRAAQADADGNHRLAQDLTWAAEAAEATAHFLAGAVSAGADLLTESAQSTTPRATGADVDSARLIHDW